MKFDINYKGKIVTIITLTINEFQLTASVNKFNIYEKL